MSLMDEKRVANAQLIDIEEFEDQYLPPAHTQESFRNVLIFALFSSNVFFALLSAFLYFQGQCPVCPSAPRQDPFLTTKDFRDARSSIGTEQHEFTGALRYNKTSGQPYRDIDRSRPQYFGNPSTTPGIDDAWKKLLRGEFFALSDQEATLYLEDSSSKESTSGHYYAELDVFHNLRCLNTVRQYLDADYYRKDGSRENLGNAKALDRTHLDYCLDRLRQSVQCSADLSIVPMLAHDSWVVSDNVLTQPRTCRKWSDVTSWLDRRHEMSRFNKQQQRTKMI